MTGLYPDCGCRKETPGVVNVVCRNAECADYGCHRRGLPDDRCIWCGEPYTHLAHDPFKGAR